MTKKKLFANNWKEYRDTPWEMFPDVGYEEYMEWRVHGWEILPTHCCVIRARTQTGKVKEYVYERTGAAENKLKKMMGEGVSEITTATHESIHHLTPRYEEDYDDPLA